MSSPRPQPHVCAVRCDLPFSKALWRPRCDELVSSVCTEKFQTVKDKFATAFGHDLDGIWAAPGRLNVIGEFTDYNDGYVLPFALAEVTRAGVARRDDDVVRVVSADAPDGQSSVASMHIAGLAPKGTVPWANYAFGVAWAMTESGHRLSGVDVYLESDVPVGAGLSSSAALECAVGLALRDLFAPDITRTELASIAQRAENAFVGVPSGIMDQSASLCCTAGHALFLDTRSREITQVPFDLESVGLRLFVIDTSVRHEHATSAYADRRSACEVAARAMHVKALRDATIADLELVPDDVVRRRARHIITENARVLSVVQLLHENRIEEIGHYLTASHESLRDDFEVTCPELDLAVEVALSTGAFGARMTVGGFGGCVIALIKEQDADALAVKVRDAFANAGFKVPRFRGAAPSEGARRVA